VSVRAGSTGFMNLTLAAVAAVPEPVAAVPEPVAAVPEPVAAVPEPAEPVAAGDRVLQAYPEASLCHPADAEGHSPFHWYKYQWFRALC